MVYRIELVVEIPGGPSLNLGVSKIFLDVAGLIDSKESALKA